MELKVNYSIVYFPFCFLLILAHSTDTTNTPTRQHLIIPQYKKTDKELSLNCITPNRDSPLANNYTNKSIRFNP